MATPLTDRTPRPRTWSRTPKDNTQAQDSGSGPCASLWQAVSQKSALGAPPGARRAAPTSDPGSVSLCPADAILVCGLPLPPPLHTLSPLPPSLQPTLIYGKKSQDPRGAGAAYISCRCLGEGGSCALGASWEVRVVLSGSLGVSQSLTGWSIQGEQGPGCEEGTEDQQSHMGPQQSGPVPAAGAPSPPTS